MHPEFLIRRAPLWLVGLAALACGAPEPVAETGSAIVGGTATGDAHAAVVFLTAEVRTFGDTPVVKVGSGTMVAPNLVATALHVISTNPSDVPFTCDANGNEVSGSNGSLLGPTVAPEKIEIYAGPEPGDTPVARGKQIVSSGSPTICQNDIAFVVLEEPVALPALPVHRGDPVALGTPLTVVGFGDGGETGPVTRTEREVTVSAIGQWLRTFTVTEGPCLGDSGGPALSSDGEVVGIFSTVAVNCVGSGAAPKYTDVSYFSSLVERAFDAAGAGSPWSGQGEPSSPESDEARGDSGCSVAGGREPRSRRTTYMLAGLGLAAVGVRRRKKR